MILTIIYIVYLTEHGHIQQATVFDSEVDAGVSMMPEEVSEVTTEDLPEVIMEDLSEVTTGPQTSTSEPSEHLDPEQISEVTTEAEVTTEPDYTDFESCFNIETGQFGSSTIEPEQISDITTEASAGVTMEPEHSATESGLTMEPTQISELSTEAGTTIEPEHPTTSKQTEQSTEDSEAIETGVTVEPGQLSEASTESGVGVAEVLELEVDSVVKPEHVTEITTTVAEVTTPEQIIEPDNDAIETGVTVEPEHISEATIESGTEVTEVPELDIDSVVQPEHATENTTTIAEATTPEQIIESEHEPQVIVTTPQPEPVTVFEAKQDPILELKPRIRTHSKSVVSSPDSTNQPPTVVNKPGESAS